MMNKALFEPMALCDYLAVPVESNKSFFTEAELKTRTEDIDCYTKSEDR